MAARSGALNMRRALELLWQLPQNLLGGCMALVLSGATIRRARRGGATVRYCFARFGGISLGSFVFVHIDADEGLVRHELGHCRQSLLLGPLYLLAVGLPSIAWASLYPVLARKGTRLDYWWFYTERWADRLGGVSRGRG